MTEEAPQPDTLEIHAVRPIIGMEVHVELATKTKMFTSAPSPAHPDLPHQPPNHLTDPVVLALPGALPVINTRAVELSILVGLALNCSIAKRPKWDRKNYFYPDLPKAYQISQYDLPLCFDGALDVPALDDDHEPDPNADTTRINIIRAHLEEDAGKLLHELPADLAHTNAGLQTIDHSIVDLNRAGTPLLEIVTAPDFQSADQCVSFAKLLRQICIHLGATQGIMQQGHIRFEPNINCELTFKDGSTARTPITEVKNLNSFKAVAGAIEYELKQQPKRYLKDRKTFGPGSKTTRGWDDSKSQTTLQREKEDAHDYRYFPDPDLPPVTVSQDWVAQIKQELVELPLAREHRYQHTLQLPPRDARQLAQHRPTADLFDRATDQLTNLGSEPSAAAKAIANILLQVAARLANERNTDIPSLGLTPNQLATTAHMRAQSKLSSNAADQLIEALAQPQSSTATAQQTEQDPAQLAEQLNLITIQDTAALDAWCQQVIDNNPAIAQQIKDGKQQAAGRLIGEVMKLSQGKADAKSARERILAKLAN